MSNDSNEIEPEWSNQFKFYFQNGAEDLRIKLEADYSPQPPTSNTTPSTPTSLVSYMETNKESGLPTSLAAIAPADMLNVWNATKLSSKSGTVNTADGEYLNISFIFSLHKM